MHTRRVISHGVQRPREVGGQVAIAVLALVGALDVAQVGSCLVAGDCSIGHAGHSRDIVTAVCDGGVLDVMGFSHDHDLPDLSRVFEIAVADVSHWVIGRHQPLLDLERERKSPDVWQSFGALVGARLGSVGSAGKAGVFGRDFRQVSRPVTQAC